MLDLESGSAFENRSGNTRQGRASVALGGIENLGPGILLLIDLQRLVDEKHP
jgi:hypothetical protein